MLGYPVGSWPYMASFWYCCTKLFLMFYAYFIHLKDKLINCKIKLSNLVWCILAMKSCVLICLAKNCPNVALMYTHTQIQICLRIHLGTLTKILQLLYTSHKTHHRQTLTQISKNEAQPALNTHLGYEKPSCFPSK